MLFWHVGGAVWGARYIFRDPGMDLRWLVVGALLPDLVDKPLGWFVVSQYETARLWGHSLLFAVVVLFGIVLFTRRGSARRSRLIPLAIGVFLHLVLDVPLESETLWWPFLGTDFPPFEYYGIEGLSEYLFRAPWIWIQEAVGLGYLMFLWRRYQLSIPSNLARLRSTGTLGFPVDAHGRHH